MAVLTALATSAVACGGGSGGAPRGMDPATWEQARAYLVDPEDGAPLVGCYSIRLTEAYGPPIRDNDSPWLDPPEGYPGLPERVVLDTARTAWGGLTMRGRTPGFGDWSEGWGLLQVRSDSVFAGWTGSFGFWGLRYELEVDGPDLEGVTWYWSDVVFARDERQVRWARVACP